MTSNPSQATAAVRESESCGLWLLMHDSWSKHAFMQVISMHCTSTIIIIYLELGLRESPSAQVKNNDWGHLLVGVKAHVENVFLDDGITKREWKDWCHGLCYFFAAQIKILGTKTSLSAAHGSPPPLLSLLSGSTCLVDFCLLLGEDGITGPLSDC